MGGTMGRMGDCKRRADGGRDMVDLGVVEALAEVKEAGCERERSGGRRGRRERIR